MTMKYSLDQQNYFTLIGTIRKAAKKAGFIAKTCNDGTLMLLTNNGWANIGVKLSLHEETIPRLVHWNSYKNNDYLLCWNVLQHRFDLNEWNPNAVNNVKIQEDSRWDLMLSEASKLLQQDTTSFYFENKGTHEIKELR